MIRATARMGQAEYQWTVAALGLSRINAAEVLGVSRRTADAYWYGDTRVPVPTTKLLRLWLALKRDKIPVQY